MAEWISSTDVLENYEEIRNSLCATDDTFDEDALLAEWIAAYPDAMAGAASGTCLVPGSGDPPPEKPFVPGV